LDDALQCQSRYDWMNEWINEGAFIAQPEEKKTKI